MTAPRGPWDDSWEVPPPAGYLGPTPVKLPPGWWTPADIAALSGLSRASLASMRYAASRRGRARPADPPAPDSRVGRVPLWLAGRAYGV